jgi:hypothetical protein
VPWPEDPEVLVPLMKEIGTTANVSLSDGVSSQHTTFTIKKTSSTWPVSIEGIDLGVHLNELRFSVTADALEWLKNQQRIKIPPRAEKHVFAENLAYALVGQSVLSLVVSIQVAGQGLVIIPAKENESSRDLTLNAIYERCFELQQEAVNSEAYKTRRKDLMDRTMHEVSIF